MMLLDTHIWVWWVDDNQQLADRQRRLIQDNVRSGLEVSAMTISRGHRACICAGAVFA